MDFQSLLPLLKNMSLIIKKNTTFKIPRTGIQTFLPSSLGGLSLWLKADAGVTIPTSGLYTYVSQIVITGSNTPNVNGTYNATSVPTFEYGIPNEYVLVGPSYTIIWILNNNYFYLQTGGFNEYWTSSDGVNWEIGDSIVDTITISGSTTPDVNGVYTRPADENVFYGPTYVIENYGNFELIDQATSTVYYTASSATGPWTIVDGSGEITSTITFAPRGSITATKVVSSSAVTAWADQSGNGRNATLNNGYTILTTIGGNAFIDFPDGTDMNLPAIWEDIEVVGTILVVAYFTSSANNSMMLSHSTDTSFDFVRGISGTNAFFLRNYPTNYVTSNLNIGNNSKNILEATFDSSTASLYLNGTSCGSGLGASITGLPNFFIGGAGAFNVAEIVVYNRVLTTEERQQVEAYLNSKYQIY